MDPNAAAENPVGAIAGAQPLPSETPPIPNTTFTNPTVEAQPATGQPPFTITGSPESVGSITTPPTEASMPPMPINPSEAPPPPPVFPQPGQEAAPVPLPTPNPEPATPASPDPLDPGNAPLTFGPNSEVMPGTGASTSAQTPAEGMSQMNQNLGPDVAPKEPNLNALNGPITEQLKPAEGENSPITHTFMKLNEMLKGAQGNEALTQIILGAAQKIVEETAQHEGIPAGSIQVDSTSQSNQSNSS